MASTAPEAKADVGRVLSRGFAALKTNFLPFLAASLPLAGLPSFFAQYWMMRSFDLSDPAFLASPFYWGGIGASLLAGLLSITLLGGILTRSTILELSRRDSDLGGSALLALRLLPALIGLSLVLALLFVGGFLLLIVPGFMIYCATIVAVPALIQERCGVFGSIERSRALTRGSRWRIFLLLVLFWVFSTVIQNVAAVLGGAAAFDMSRQVIPDPFRASLVVAIGTSMSTMIVAVVTAALYVELREVKEGASANELADVFA
jgi:hypothetical protein